MMQAWFADVDAFMGVLGTTPTEAYYRASARDQLAGRWLGCYTQPVAAFAPMWMDLQLDLRGPGPEHDVQADGVDGLGRFSIVGNLEASSGDVRLRKQYVDAHGVRYDGVLADRAIRGVWSLGVAEGVFALWNAETLAAADIERGARAVKSRGSALAQVAALLTAPIRMVTLVRHARLVSRFRRLRPDFDPR